MNLTVENIGFSYVDKRIFEQLSFQVKDGEFVSILGPSGCGKSTLLNVLTGILRPTCGRILIDGEETSGITSRLTYMPQNDLLLPWKNILDNVCLYGEIHGTKAQMRKQAKARMEQFGLSGYEEKFPDELSGGMRQRAAFLRTTMCDAGIYLLDEPFGALDVITRADMQDWLRSLCRSLCQTILLVTHDTDEAIYLSDRILILGEPGSGIQGDIEIKEQERTREWLYEQSALRARIHRIIREGNRQE